MSRRRASQRGLTLLDVAVTILVIAFLVRATPYTLTEVDRARNARAWYDAGHLYNAEFGTRDLNGFVGDIGRLSPPANAVNEMGVAAPTTMSSQNWATYNRPQVMFRGATAGWSGPYSGFSPAALTRDPWGNPWILDPDGRVRSPGADGLLGSLDDISVPVAGNSTLLPSGSPDGQVNVLVESPDNPTLLGAGQVTVQVGKVDTNGNFSLAAAAAPSGSNAYFSVTGLAPGRHVVVAKGAAAFAGAAGVTATWVGGKQHALARVKLSRACCQGF